MIVSFLCLGWWAFALTSGMTTPPPPSDIQLSASTNSIHGGFTKSLTVTCSYLHHQGSDMSVVTLLILSKTASVGGTQYTDIATITQANPDSVEVKDDLGAKVTGKLTPMGTSSIVYEWTYPAQTAEGQYQCTAHGLNSVGHPTMTSAGTVIEEKSVNLQMIVEKVQSLESHQDVLMHLLSNTTAQLNEKDKELNSIKLDLNSTKWELDQTKNKLQLLENNEINTMKQDITALRHNQDTKVMFSAGFTGSSVAVSGGYVVVFGYMITSVGGGYDNRTGVFTAPVSGYYMATVHVLSTPDHLVEAFLQHNNRSIVYAFADNNLDLQAASNGIALHLHQGDTVRVFSRGTLHLDSGSTFSVHLVSA